MVLQDLYCDFKLNKLRKKYTNWKTIPVCFTEFVTIVQSCILNLNLENHTYFENLYESYSTKYFELITKQDFKTYNTRFSAFNCLGIYSTHAQNEAYWLDRGWNIEQIKDIRSKKFGTCSIDFLLNKGFSLEDAKNKLKITTNKIQEKSLKTKKETGNFGRQTVETYIKMGLTENEAKQKMLEIGKKRSAGIIKWNKRNPNYFKNAKRPNQIQYWLNKGFSEEESKQFVKERQKTFTLEKCIAKYGEELGIKKYNDRNSKWSAKIESKYKNGEFSKKPKSINSTRISNISKTVIDELLKFYPDAMCYKNEFEIFDEERGKRMGFDFKVGKKIIEINGDFWHMNPSIYDKDYFNKRTKKFAYEKWEIDKQKVELANSYNYTVLTIWESDFKQDKKQVIEKCIEFLN
jgi:hypothetical protein